jgi:DNA invertase Pin-like site-specific DNA recombinase
MGAMRQRAHKALGYVRVSTQEQADTRNGLEAQRARIQEEADRRGWTLEWVEDAGYSGKTLDRPGIAYALDELETGRADVLVAAKLDRLSRRVIDFAGLMDASHRQRWALVALDCDVDTSTPSGEMMAGVMAQFAQFERRCIAQRTKDALAIVRATSPKHIGRPVRMDPGISQDVADLRACGLTLYEVAEALNGLDAPTVVPGARWHIATVRKVLAARAYEAELAARQSKGVSQ